MHRPRQLDLNVLGRPVSLLVAEAAAPRAVVYALHGGSSGKEYFDSRLDPSLSLLRLGPQLGFTVIAPDRPGYGPGAAESGGLPPEERTELLYATLDAALAGRGRGEGTFVMGHSMGCVSALRMAADPRGADLVGLEISGTGRTVHAAADVYWTTRTGPGPTDGPLPSLRPLVWGPERLYPLGAHRAAPVSPSPLFEGTDYGGWAEELPELAARVPVPVRYSLAEHEAWWRSGVESSRSVAALFKDSPLVETAVERSSGHNISLGFTARAYHLRVLAFTEQCLALRRCEGRPGSPERPPGGSSAAGSAFRGR
ncbi:alpha/beta hydrolase [Streptomyces sp. NPDC048251]|uniref:alpha/beta hydrolase n=1 Tax=Streptomyces sp. NPDC048251 TaxID=3154501 RepID=UPI00342526BE